MGLLSNLFGTPKEHTQEKRDREVVKTPEFDITQYAKKLAATLAVFAPAIAGVIKVIEPKDVSPAIVVGALGVSAAALLGLCLVMAVDLASRAYLSGEGSAKEEGENKQAAAESKVIPMPPGTLVWLQGDERPLPLLAVSDAGDSYLVASGETFEAGRTGQGQQALKGAPKWEAAEKVVALKPSKWKP